MPWLAEMTRKGKIFNLLYFKGLEEYKQIQLKLSNEKDLKNLQLVVIQKANGSCLGRCLIAGVIFFRNNVKHWIVYICMVCYNDCR